MKKWWVGWALVILACLPIYLQRSSHPGLLEDSDTKVLLQAIRDRQDPLSWFGGDWPLGNHFYRPVTTLVFELDNSISGTNAAGYGLTNALLCIACVLLLFWFFRELTSRLEIAVPGAVIFALWHVGWTGPLMDIAHWMALLALPLAFVNGRRVVPAALAFLVLVFLEGELGAMFPLRPRMIEWLPGRTASVMTLFVLLSLACYARFERISASRRRPPEPGPLDPPATKGTEHSTERSRFAYAWLAASVVSLAAALGSYEQAVMAPALLFGTALCLCLQGQRVRWGWQALFWGVLAAYLILRANLVPSDVSSYQAQQFRTGPGVLDSLLAYLVPAWGSLRAAYLSLDVGAAIWLTVQPWLAFIKVGSNVAIVAALRKDWVLPTAGWAMSFAAFLPMAWLKHFEHYHYLPMAMRSLMVAALIGVAGKVLINAASRPALQAPPRLDPAPGSLPRR